jgi:hypothetical protein
LVLTLLAVVLIAIVVVAFMQTMSLALISATGYANVERANLASQGGLEAAVAQLRQATGTNLAFVTGLLNDPTNAGASVLYPVTVIGARDLTNYDQIMPLMSGPVNSLTNYNSAGFSNDASAYLAARLTATNSVDVNNANSTNLNFIQVMMDTNMYRAPWVIMTNMVGSQPNYTRYAYVMTDEAGRINPLLATGSGTGYSNPTNWYTGPQDISITNSSAQLLTSDQVAQLTNAAASFGYSEATLGQVFPNRADYEAVKNYFTTKTNTSVDMIPAWLPDGTNGTPKYNINDLATNTAYGATPTARAINIGTIIGRNLTNFYSRDPALSGTNTTLYLDRLGADIVEYISPPNTFTTNTAGISPPGNGPYPVLMTARNWLGPVTSTSATVYEQYYVNVWNPYSKPVTISTAVLHIWNEPTYSYKEGHASTMPTYNSSVYYVGGNGSRTLRPNEYVALGFATNTLLLGPGTGSETYVEATPTTNTANPDLIQFSLTINGQVVAQSQGLTGAATPGGGLERSDTEIVAGTNSWCTDFYQVNGNPVSDPRFLNYQYTVWTGISDASTYLGTAWNGFPGSGTTGTPGSHAYNPASMWTNCDNYLIDPPEGVNPKTVATTPDQCSSTYTTNYAWNAPDYISNTNMASIGELGNVYDPAHVNNFLDTNNWAYGTSWHTGALSGSGNGTYYMSPLQVGGARSLRIGAPDYTVSGPPGTGWDVAGERAISLLDLFTVNSTNLAMGGVGGRVNPNTASTNVLAAMFAGIRVNSDTNSAGANLFTMANPTDMAAQLIAKRPYSGLSDLSKAMRAVFYLDSHYSPDWQVSPSNPYDFNYINRVRQEAFGKWIQHVTLQSHRYRVYVIGQVLDNKLNPTSSTVIEAGVGLQYQAASGGNPAQYLPFVEYIHYLK